MYTQLFSEINIGCHNIKNRIIMSQPATGLAINNCMTEQLITYYAERAIGGAGLIEMEPILLEPSKTEKHINMPCLYNKDNMNKWYELSGLLHAYGTKLLCTVDCRETIANETAEAVISKIVGAAKNMHDLGIDGISLIQGNGYWKADSFQYLNRLIKALAESCGKDFLIGAHLSMKEIYKVFPDIGKCRESAKEIGRAGVNYLVVPDSCPELIRTIKEYTGVSVAAQVRYKLPDECNRLISDGTADMIVLDRQLVCDPYWPEKAEIGRISEIRSCIHDCRKTCVEIAAGGSISCEINPYAGNESRYTERDPGLSAKAKNIIVIGSSTAGIQAAITASKRGHYVSVFEKEEELGKELMDKDITAAHWFIDEMKRNRVDVRLGISENEEYIEAFKPDAVFITADKKGQNRALISALREKGIQVIVIHNDFDDSMIGHAIKSGFHVANRV